MSLLQSLKPFWPMLLTFIIPRAIGYYRALRVAVRTRPPPKPLPDKTAQGLNALFAAIGAFLVSSLPLRKSIDSENIFVTTDSRLHIPTDVLFARLALSRPDGVLAAGDEALRSKLTTPILRKLYLRFGASTILSCSFCQPEDDLSYLLYHLPTNVILPHLFHFLALGLATSEAVSGFDASRWRFRVLLGALALLLLDLYLTATYEPKTDVNLPSPSGIFLTFSTLRPLTLCFYDALVAFTIYASATGRFLIFATPAETDPELARRNTENQLNQANVALQLAQAKLRAFSVARNAVVRDEGLKEADDEYWRAVVAMEAPEADESLWEDEEVQAAMASVYGNGKLDVPRMKKEAEAFVANVTRGLESET